MIAFGLSSETRDLSIQLLDQFLSESLAHSNNGMLHINLTLFGAAISMVVASKLLEYNPLSMTCFRQFQHKDLAMFERHFLSVLGYNISPMSTPTHFAHFYLRLWPAHVKYSYVFEVVEQLIGKFWEGETL